MARMTHPPFTLAQLHGAKISWHRSRIRYWEKQTQSRFAAGQIADHWQKIAQLIEPITPQQNLAHELLMQGMERGFENEELK